MSRPRSDLGKLDGLRKARDVLKPAGPAQLLDADGNPARSFADAAAVGWVDDPELDKLPDAEDLVEGIARGHGKIRAADNTVAKVRARLATEITEAKSRRETRDKKTERKTV